MKKLVSILMVSLMISCLFACGKKASNEQASNNTVANNTVVTNSASANVPPEYKQVTTNENGVKIYGKIVDENSASEVGKKVIQANALSDKKIAKEGLSVTYSEYYSDAYGGTVIIRTGNKTGSQSVYNENGQRFMSGEAKYELEQSLAKYRLGNAMAEAIDRKVSGK